MASIGNETLYPDDSVQDRAIAEISKRNRTDFKKLFQIPLVVLLSALNTLARSIVNLTMP